MINAKQAVEIARRFAGEMIGRDPLNLEELERELYKDRDAWSVTLSFPQERGIITAFSSQFGMQPLQYRRFLVDAETGDFIALKLREVASTR